MRRYSNQSLGPKPHIVVLGSCKVGNFIATTPALEGLRNRFPDAVIGFLGSDVTADLETAHPCIDWRCSWDAVQPDSFLAIADFLSHQCRLYGHVDLAINLDGFNPVTQVLTSFLQPIWVSGVTLDSRRRRLLPVDQSSDQAFLNDDEWDSSEFIQRYSPLLQTNHIAELFAVLAGVRGYCNPTIPSIPIELPGFPVPDVLIHCTTARQAKIWPFSHWQTVVESLTQRGYSVGLVGSAPKEQRSQYHSGFGEDWLLSCTSLQDLRGATSLVQLAGACQQAKAVLSVDAGPLHIAAAVGTPVLAIVGNDANGVGASPIRLWLPRSDNCFRTTTQVTCSLCAESRFKNDDCLVDGHPCMHGVSPDQVITWLSQVLSESSSKGCRFQSSS